MDLNIKILVVDDFATMRRILKNNLRQLGFSNILEAEDGQLALEELKKNKVDLIISDWNMPNMSGLELLKAVRGDESFKQIPFVMVTAEGQKDNVMEAAKAGVSNYVVKPFTPEIFEEKLKKVLS
ncbi:chemotaxis response regulator CheY [Desulfobacula sp.]|uniref:chemotaxis response regulator CheY n=1 Tax=Desulfobacula sp. TaxID=2593537 RepID=UPI001ECF7422|nr:chemotaxis response regulator CheY [Desulfobacula sp.]